jgi:hypothetical protein
MNKEAIGMNTQERRNRIDRLIAEAINLAAEEKRLIETPAWVVIDYYDGSVDCFFQKKSAEQRAESYRNPLKRRPKDVEEMWWSKEYGVTVEEYIPSEDPDGCILDMAIRNIKE